MKHARLAVVVGLGGAHAGDDAVGLQVARLLAAEGFVTCECEDATRVAELLSEGERVVVIDALVGGEPGAVVHVAPDALQAEAPPVSTHGLSLAQAVGLARTLYGEDVLTRLDIVGVGIDRPRGPSHGLSLAVRRAVAPAADLVRRLASHRLHHRAGAAGRE